MKIPEEVDNKIKQIASERYPDDFAEQLNYIETQKKAYLEINDASIDINAQINNTDITPEKVYYSERYLIDEFFEAWNLAIETESHYFIQSYFDEYYNVMVEIEPFNLNDYKDEENDNDFESLKDTGIFNNASSSNELEIQPFIIFFTTKICRMLEIGDCNSTLILNLVELLLLKKDNYNELDSNGKTVLHHLAGNDDLQKIKLLVKNQVKVNVKDKEGCIPLHHAKQKNTIEYLVRNGSDPMAINNNNETPAFNIVRIIKTHYVVKEGEYPDMADSFSNDLSGLKFYISCGINTNIINNDNETLLDIAKKDNVAGTDQLISLLKEASLNSN